MYSFHTCLSEFSLRADKVFGPLSQGSTKAFTAFTFILFPLYRYFIKGILVSLTSFQVQLYSEAYLIQTLKPHLVAKLVQSNFFMYPPFEIAHTIW